jgi:hypothetical protein
MEYSFYLPNASSTTFDCSSRSLVNEPVAGLAPPRFPKNMVAVRGGVRATDVIQFLMRQNASKQMPANVAPCAHVARIIFLSAKDTHPNRS